MKQTSALAFEHITVTGKRETLRARVESYVCLHPGCTQMDISRDLGESARKRVAELVRACQVFEYDQVRINGLLYTTYAARYEPQTRMAL